MKKVLLSSLMVLAFLITNGQVLINETFSSGTFPPEGWSISAQEGNWSAVNSSYAGGEAPEARLNWDPAFTATSQLIFPAINMAEIETSAIVVSFKHMIDHYSGTYDIGLAARIDGGDWQNVWTQSVNQSIAAENKQLIIEDVDIINSTELEFAIFFSGNSYNINYWYIDDIRVIVPEGFDLALSNVEIPTVFNEILPLGGTVQNIGSESITSFDLNWRINYGSVQTHSYTDLDIPSFNNFDFSLAGILDLDPGSHNIKVYIDNINGQNTDDNTENNSTVVEFDVASNSVSRKPLFESFTSSTCPPCYSFNTGYFNEFTETNADDITLIKYQMNWPGSGDPYYNDDGGIRRNYYGISAVPSLIIEGDGVSLSEEAINEALEAGKQKPSFAMIESSYTIDGDGVFVFGNILPFANIESAQLHVAVVEKTTYDNATSNGETFFKHVMHKMLPDGNGTSIELNNLETFQFNHQFDMSTTHVEEMEDLIVVVFMQDQSTREIYQSQYAHVADAPVATFNVVNDADKVDINKTFTVSFDQPVKDEDGSTLTPETAANRINFNDVIRKAAVDFTVEINDNKTQFIITPNASLDFSTNYEIEVLPLMGITGAVSTAQSVIFQTRDIMAAPVANFEILNGEENVDVDIPINIHFNQAVRDLNGDEFTTETAAERLILKVSDELGEDVPFTVELNGDHTSF
ncbi:MAG: Ig-like domain-containing protein, partial [Bacteroidales bacterium]